MNSLRWRHLDSSEASHPPPAPSAGGNAILGLHTILAGLHDISGLCLLPVRVPGKAQPTALFQGQPSRPRLAAGHVPGPLAHQPATCSSLRNISQDDGQRVRLGVPSVPQSYCSRRNGTVSLFLKSSAGLEIFLKFPRLRELPRSVCTRPGPRQHLRNTSVSPSRVNEETQVHKRHPQMLGATMWLPEI